MSPRRKRSEVVAETLVTGVVTVLWYAMADVVRSRGARAALKVGLLAAGSAYAWAATRSDDGSLATEGPGVGAGGPVSDELEQVRVLTTRTPVLDADSLGLERGAPSTRARWFPVVALAAVGGSVAGTVAVERAVHRLGERLAARGVVAPHTRVGLVAGAASVLLSLLAARAETSGAATAGT